MPDTDPGPPRPDQGKALPLQAEVKVVHLRPGPDGYDNDGVRRSWQAADYATLAAMEGHPVNTECPLCSRRGPGNEQPPRPAT